MDHPPESAEYLNSLLTGPNGGCPHPDKQKTAPVPQKMGFFSGVEDSTAWIETDKFCQACYDQAAPRGFNAWSLPYKPSERPMDDQIREQFRADMMDSDEWSRRYGWNAETDAARRSNFAALRIPDSTDYYPPMWQAGVPEDDQAWERRRMPANAEAREAFDYMRHDGRPYYVDQQHLSRPWDPNAPDQTAENRRVAQENLLAYQGAAQIFSGTGVGGAGVNSIVEQRIAGDRLRELPGAWRNDPNQQADASNHRAEPSYSGPGNDPTQQRYGQEVSGNAPNPGNKVHEVPPRWPEYYNMPSNDYINREEMEMRGETTRPTGNELHRRWWLEPRAPTTEETGESWKQAHELAGTPPYSRGEDHEMRAFEQGRPVPPHDPIYDIEEELRGLSVCDQADSGVTDGGTAEHNCRSILTVTLEAGRDYGNDSDSDDKGAPEGNRYWDDRGRDYRYTDEDEGGRRWDTGDHEDSHEDDRARGDEVEAYDSGHGGGEDDVGVERDYGGDYEREAGRNDANSSLEDDYRDEGVDDSRERGDESDSRVDYEPDDDADNGAYSDHDDDD